MPLLGVDTTTLVAAHLKVLRNAGTGAGASLDSTTQFTKNIPTIRAGVTVPDDDLNTELAVYITANG